MPDAPALVMFPVDMAPPNPLRRGDIVEKEGEPGRWLVLHDPGTMRAVHPFIPVAASDVDLLRIGRRPASLVTSNMRREWVPVPWEKCTAEERVQSTLISWRPISERTPEEVAESGEADDDHEAWHLLTALLPPAVAAGLQLGDWPTTAELALEVARRVRG